MFVDGATAILKRAHRCGCKSCAPVWRRTTVQWLTPSDLVVVARQRCLLSQVVPAQVDMGFSEMLPSVPAPDLSRSVGFRRLRIK